MDEAAAPRRISIEATSLGFRSVRRLTGSSCFSPSFRVDCGLPLAVTVNNPVEIDASLTMTPSTTNSGSADPTTVFEPRI